jgi:hypothetical protein
MARIAGRPEPTAQQTLEPLICDCPACGQRMWVDYDNHRTVTTLHEVLALRLKIRRCHNPDCARRHKPYRPEAEGQIALPEHEFGLDVMALVGALRYGGHRSVPEIHQELLARRVAICQRSVSNLLDRYDELLALSLSLGDDRRLRKLVQRQGRVILAIDGLQPDVGHEVLWVIRECLSGEVLCARSLLSATERDLAELIGLVRRALADVPVAGVISDGQHSIRNAVAEVLPDVPHQLCHFHYLREAARPLYEMDRHAKKELKKQVRGVRPIERAVENRTDPQAQAVRGYCAAVRSAISDDGRPPLDASGLKLHGRLASIHASLLRVNRKKKKGSRQTS